MELTADEIIERYAKKCGHCNRNTLLPHEYEWSCLSCGFNLIKIKHELSKIQRKGINFINRIKYSEQRIFCVCVGVYKIHEGDDYDKLYEVLSTLRNKKIKINNVLIENYKDMLEDLDFEQDYWSKTAEVIYKIGHDTFRLMKGLSYYDRSYYDNINYYDLMGSICTIIRVLI